MNSTTLGESAVATVKQLADTLRDSIQRVIVGKTEAVDLVTIALLSRGHVLIEDVPGTGKTTLAKALAASLSCDFARVQFTPDLVPTDILGVNVFDPKENTFQFRPGPVFTQVFLADEINRATPRTQSALLEAMQEGQVSSDGVTSRLPSPFFVLATLNPVEMEGTFPLPEAQLDRFMLCASLGYPSHGEEAAMLDRFRGKPTVLDLEAVLKPEDIISAQVAVDGVRIDPAVRDYVLAIIEATRSHKQLRLGASPRASRALQSAAQARAAMDGRDFVVPDDVKVLATPVLAHRLIGDVTVQLHDTSQTEIVGNIIADTPVPIEH